MSEQTRWTQTKIMEKKSGKDNQETEKEKKNLN